MGPRRLINWQCWVTEGEKKRKRRLAKKQRGQVTRSNSAHPGFYKWVKESEGLTGRAETAAETERERERARPATSFRSRQSIGSPSIHPPVHPSVGPLQRHEETPRLQLPRLGHGRVHRRGAGRRLLVSILRSPREKWFKGDLMVSSCDCCWLIHCEQNPNGELHMLSLDAFL